MISAIGIRVPKSITGRNRFAFTLIELLVVVLILSILAGVALPNIKKTLKNQKSTQAVRLVKAMFEEARDRAIATESYIGVVIDRLGTTGDFERGASIRMRLSKGVPPYSGESEQSVANLFHDNGATAMPSFTATGITNAASFLAVDNPLIDLSARSGGTGDAPIQIGDRLELRGGRTVRITAMRVYPPITTATPTPVGTIVNYDPRELIRTREAYNAATTYSTYAFPGNPKFSNGVASPSRFKIHRAPVPSAVGSVDMMRGTAIDLNYSGIGPNGSQFSPFVIDSTNVMATSDTPYQPIVILFAPDGSVALVNYGLKPTSTSAIIPYSEIPTGNIYLCVGTTDGVRPDNLFDEGKSTANIMNSDSNWVVINPASGNITASANAPVVPPTSTVTADALSEATIQARAYALISDTLDNI